MSQFTNFLHLFHISYYQIAREYNADHGKKDENMGEALLKEWAVRKTLICNESFGI
jgi:hypothetical protein